MHLLPGLGSKRLGKDRIRLKAQGIKIPRDTKECASVFVNWEKQERP